MKDDADSREITFRFPVELGTRLRKLRRQAGLTQRELARLMGRVPSRYQAQIARIERARTAFPTLAFIADYLRACRASFADIEDVLDTYTSRAPVPDREGRRRVQRFTRTLPVPVAKEIENYDIRTAVARRFSGRKPLAPDKRELRARRLAAAWFHRNKLDAWLNQAVNDIGVLPVLAVRFPIFAFGHKVWRILKQTRTAPGVIRRPDKKRRTREQLLDEAERKAVEQARGVVPASGFRYVRDTVSGLFALMESKGEFEWVPTATQAVHIPRPTRLRRPRGRTMGDIKGIDPGHLRRARLMSHLQTLVNKRMEQERIDDDRRLRYLRWLPRVALIAQETEDNPKERTRRTGKLTRVTSNPKQARRIAQWFYEEYEKWRPKWEKA